MPRQLILPSRRGAIAVESAIVYPVMIILLLCTLIGGMGVFRYQQVAAQAREAARWAAVRGSDYRRATEQPSPTADQIREAAVLPLAAGMDPAAISVQVQWVNPANGEVVDWDRSSKHPKNLSPSNGYNSNRVRVTVTYQWSPEILAGALYLKSTCEVPMSF